MYEAQLVKKTDGILNLWLRLRWDPYKRNLKYQVERTYYVIKGKIITYIDITLLFTYLHIIVYIFTYNCLQLFIEENVNLQNFKGCEVTKTESWEVSYNVSWKSTTFIKNNKDEEIFNRSQWWTTEFENHGIKYLTLPKNLCRHRDLTSDVTMFIVKIY